MWFRKPVAPAPPEAGARATSQAEDERPLDQAPQGDAQAASDMADPDGAAGKLFGRQALVSLFRGANQVSPVDFQILGRTLLHAALVGLAAGLIGAAFFAGLEWCQRLLLERLAGYQPLRAAGERFLDETTGIVHDFRPWLLAFLPAAGALLSGLVSQLAPETRGGGGDAMIEAFHHEGGNVRRRVIAVKSLSSLFTLGSGGAGGREGPTMLIGAAVGSTVGRYLKLSTNERRILMVAGVAAGIAAVFRTPLGAALLAVEVLYRDDFESDALIPAVLASVVAYSVVTSIYGASTLFAQPHRFPFTPAHLPYYALLAILVSLLAILFLTTLRTVQRVTRHLPLPPWATPAAGGLALGVLAAPIVTLVGHAVGEPGQGVGLLGGGYGAVQVAISGISWLGIGWPAVLLLLSLCFVKILAASLTIGTGGSAGDFAPCMVVGGLFGGAFGRIIQNITGDPRIDAGAFTLVAMGTFYGGLAHVPLASLIMVCELAGSYDLLVPLMLAEGIAFVALRNRALYTSQVPTRRHSPAYADRSGLFAIPPTTGARPTPTASTSSPGLTPPR